MNAITKEQPISFCLRFLRFCLLPVIAAGLLLCGSVAQACHVGDFVWEDLNGNGIQDDGEPGIEGVSVEFYRCDDTFVNSTTTNSEGRYHFPVSLNVCYYLKFVLPDGCVFSLQDQGGDNAIDSDPDPTTGLTDNFSVPSGNDLTWDAGILCCIGTIGDFVWHDLDRDGIQDPGEPGLNGVTVRLKDAMGAVASTDTGPGLGGTNGFYEFTGLCAGNYEVEVDESTLPPGFVASTCSDDPDPYASGNDKDSNCNPQAVNLANDNSQNPTIDFGYNSPECTLQVEKFCTVQAPSEPFDCNDAKPINCLTMIWTGTETVDVVAHKGKLDKPVLATVTNVEPGEEITICGFAGCGNDIEWEMFQTGTSQSIGKSRFHVSCSDSEMNGPEDCGNLEGNGKDNKSGLDLWEFAGMAGVLTLDCTPESPVLAEQCEIIPTPPASCETEGKPTSLTFLYTGKDCTASNHGQGDKAECNGDPGFAEPVQVIYTGKDASKFTVEPSDESINVGDPVTITRTDGNDFKADTKLEIRQSGACLQALKIHTSCSKPLEVGDVFGSLELVAFNGQGATGNEVTYTYKVTNIGDVDVFDVTIEDNKLGTVQGSPIYQLAPGDSVELTATTLLSETTMNTVIVTGNTEYDDQCSAMDSVTVTVTEPPPASCADGNPKALRFRYTGESCDASNNDQGDKAKCTDPGTLTEPVQIVYTGKDADKITVSPGDESIYIDDSVTIEATGRDRLHSNTKLEIRQNGVVMQKLEIHTSCSQPLNVGDQFGSLVLEEFTPEN
jgi:hypothetical protein